MTPGRFPDEWIDRAWAALDRGTKRAILRLYRSAPESELERAGGRLGELRCPALILWAQQDIYLPARFGQACAEALGGDVTLEPVEGGGGSLVVVRSPGGDRPRRGFPARALTVEGGGDDVKATYGNGRGRGAARGRARGRSGGRR